MEASKKCIAIIVGLVLILSACGAPAVSENRITDHDEAATWQEQYDLGMRYLTEGSYEQAIIAFTAAIEIDPKRADAYAGRGDAYISMMNMQTAESDYLTTLELDASQVGVYSKLADIYLSQGNTERAIEILRAGYESTSDIELGETFERLLGTPHLMTHTKEDGGLHIVYGQEDLEGRLQGFCVMNEFDAKGNLTYLAEAVYTDGEHNGEMKNSWWNAEKGEYGIGIGPYQDGERNGYSMIRCYRGMIYPEADATGVIRFDGLEGIDLYFEYRGFLIGDIREDDSGEAYMMWLEKDDSVAEYYGSFHDGKQTGYGRLFSNGALRYEGEFVDGRMK